MRAWRIGILIATLVSVVSAQGQAPVGTASFRGRLVDSARHTPLIRGQLCVTFSISESYSIARCGHRQPDGWLLLDSMPAGRIDVVASCATTQFFGKRLATIAVDFAAGEHREQDVVVSSDGCDERPITSRAGEYSGYYTYGFEEGRFRWTGDTTLGIWVTFARRPASGGSIEWPASTEENPYPCVFVRWFGTLTGPDRYGHLGIASYQVSVDSVAEVRAAPKAACPH